ncbi:hypothetical protein ACFV2U_54670 [Streptomyces sp. NPDC059697]|uniref:hypothetical protein n=1 Tax=Streptomyces sp. NPDC059697 TaxID=3346912 RepID=UPI0036D0D87B
MITAAARAVGDHPCEWRQHARMGEQRLQVAAVPVLLAGLDKPQPIVMKAA